jgi:hypothetical protein
VATKHTFTIEIVFNNGTPPTFGTSYLTDLFLDDIKGDNLIKQEANRISIKHSVASCDPEVCQG